MSGGNCPETPRQKMIGMMYLFLTAMLALNVSGDLLKAFVLVDDSIKTATKTVEGKNNITFAQFKNIKESNPDKVGERFKKCEDINAEADKLVKHIQDLKVLIVTTADGPEATPENYPSMSNQDIAPQIMITEQGAKRSKDLIAAINAYRDLIIANVEPSDTSFIHSIKAILNTDEPKPVDGVAKSWESEKFEHIPLAASMALMSKMQSDARNAQAEMTRYLLSKVDEKSFKFTKVEPLIIPTSKYVLRGNKYEAVIMMAATDETAPPLVKIPGIGTLDTDQGKAILSIPAGSVGAKKLSGTITYKGPDGITEETKDLPEIEYFVMEPTAVISPVKMNVFYEGVENPVRVSVPGVANSQLNISWGPNVSVKQDGELFIIRPNAGSAGLKCAVSVSIKGKKGSFSSQEFRIKRVPDPVVKVAKLREGKIKKTLLIAQAGIFAEMDNFDFELEFKVTSFNVSTIKGGYLKEVPAQGNLFTKEQQELIKGLSPGSKVFFDNVKAVSASNPTDRRSLGAITLTID